MRKEKVALCAIGKWEEQYLPEWVEHYKSLEFDNIIFYDNNEKYNKKQYKVLKPYINKGFVIYNDYRGIIGEHVQKIAYHNCMKKYKTEYDWIAFFDCDEFLELVEYKNVKDFLNSNEKFKEFSGVSFNWMYVGDNDLIYNDKRPLKERFYSSKLIKSKTIKTIVNTHKCGEKLISVHTPFSNSTLCDYNGNVVVNTVSKAVNSKPIYDKAFIRHYKGKTIEEVIDRIKRGDCNKRTKVGFINVMPLNVKITFYLKQFFNYNKITVQKLNVIIKEFPCFIESEYYKILFNSVAKNIMKTKVKNTIIIGGTSDIGIEIIKNMIDRGHVVYSTYNNTKPTFQHERLFYVKADLSKNDEVYSFIEYIKEKITNIDTFIYNAGTTCRKKMIDVLDEDIYDVFNINVFQCYKMIRDFFTLFSNDAKIIVTGSQMGVMPHSVSTLYGMSKECLHSMVKNLVKEFDGTNITINAIVPGFVDTQWQKNKPVEIRDNICKKTALHRFATVEEIVKGYEFCIDNDFVNGSLIEINGGYNYK